METFAKAEAEAAADANSGRTGAGLSRTDALAFRFPPLTGAGSPSHARRRAAAHGVALPRASAGACSNNLLSWGMIQHAVGRGFRTIDFRRSAPEAVQRAERIIAASTPRMCATTSARPGSATRLRRSSGSTSNA